MVCPLSVPHQNLVCHKHCPTRGNDTRRGNHSTCLELGCLWSWHAGACHQCMEATPSFPCLDCQGHRPRVLRVHTLVCCLHNLPTGALWTDASVLAEQPAHRALWTHCGHEAPEAVLRGQLHAGELSSRQVPRDAGRQGGTSVERDSPPPLAAERTLSVSPRVALPSVTATVTPTIEERVRRT